MNIFNKTSLFAYSRIHVMCERERKRGMKQTTIFCVPDKGVKFCNELETKICGFPILMMPDRVNTVH